MYRVRLINRIIGTSAQQFPVCGRSRLNYGQAVLNVALGGPVFDMSLEAYNRDKFDLVGNIEFQQQWVPDFYEVRETSPTELPVGDQEHEALCSAATKESASRETSPTLPESDRRSPRKEKSITERAKDAGVWKKGMTDEQMREALGFPD